MYSLLKALGLVLYIILSPLFAFVEGSIFCFQGINYAAHRIHFLKTKHKKQLVSFIRHQRHYFRWSIK